MWQQEVVKLNSKQVQEDYKNSIWILINVTNKKNPTNCNRFSAKFLVNHRALQSLEELRRHPGFVGFVGGDYRLLRQQPGPDRAQCRTRPLERPGYGNKERLFSISIVQF